jgi:CRP/FNR family transcriptional regulator
MDRDKIFVHDKLMEEFGNIFEPRLIEEIAEVGMLRTIGDGELLIEIGDELTHTPILLTGSIKVSLDDHKGHEVFLYHISQGETCAISFINCIQRQVSIFRGIADQDSLAVMIPVAYLDSWLAKYSTWRHYIIDSYHFRLINVVQSIKMLSFNKLEDRVLAYLKERVGLTDSHELKIKHEEIATDLNSARTAISRILKDFEHRGLLELRRGRILINEDL